MSNDTGYKMHVTQDLMDCVIARVTGVVAGDETAKFRRHFDEIIEDSQVRRVVLDLTAMESMSPRAFGVIVSGLIILRSRQRDLAVVGARDNFKTMMTMTGLAGVVKCYRDQHEALRDAW